MQSLTNEQTLEQFFEPLYDLFQLLGCHHADIMMTWAVVAKVAWELAPEAPRDSHGIPGHIQIHGDGVSW